MSEQNNGGQAFPRIISSRPKMDNGMRRMDGLMEYHTEGGMSLRDYFAAKALPDVYAEFWRAADNCPPDWELGVAADAYRMADAMLKMRQAT